MAEPNKNASPASQSMRKTVYDGILKYITEHDIKPGDKLPSEFELAEMLGVSRTSLREGIRMLEGAGFITTKHGGGMYVAEYDGSILLDYVQYSIGYGSSDVSELYEIRKCLEIHHIGEVAEHVTEDQLERLRALTEKMRAFDPSNNEELLQYHWYDMDFHLTLYENIKNRLSAHLIQLYWDIMLTRHMPQRMGNLPGVIAGNHEMIIRALESHDPNFARTAMQVHMFDSHIV